MGKFKQGAFTPRNPDKCMNKSAPRYRSSWELVFMQMCDNHPHIVQWGSEVVKIPYVNPLTGKGTVYVPDFIIVYLDKNGKNHAELIEVKPKAQTMAEHAKSKKDMLHAAVNKAKWLAAYAWSQKKGLKFRIITEDEIFMKPPRKPKPKLKPRRPKR
jgi:hypothetical protein